MMARLSWSLGAVVATLAVVVASCATNQEDTYAGPPLGTGKTDGAAGDTGTGTEGGQADGPIADGPAGDAGDDGGCLPKTCLQLGAQCGSAPDGCGGTLACGDCPSGQSCGGGGAYKCGTAACTPTSCNAQGAECGSIGDSCGGTLQCGTCTHGSCAGNVCQCTPTTCNAAGVQCGAIPNNCGGTLQCGSCPGNQSCLSGSCGCPSGQHLCGANCIANGTCCTDGDCSGMNVCASPGSACSCRTSPARMAIYRSYAWNGDHFFSPSQSEGPNAGYTDEGVRYYDYAGPCQWGLLAFYRLVGASGEHFYTISAAERDTLMNQGWVPEGDIGCIADNAVCGAVTLFRLVQPGGKHMFTTDAAERDALVLGGWIQEGPAGFVWLSP